MSPHELHRVRAAVVAVLALTVALSLAANVLSAEPSLIGRAVAAWPPLALLICTDLISRVPTSRRAVGVARQAAAVAIAAIAAALSYGHMVTLAADHGASNEAAHVVPLTVDGLAVVASLCLLEIGARLRQHANTTAQAPPAPATPGQRAAGTPDPCDRTDRTDRTLNLQVRGVAFRHAAAISACDRTDKTPSRPAKAALTTAGDDLAARVRALAVEHPGWTQAAIAEAAGCSVRTVRRHLTTDALTTSTTDTSTDDTQEAAA